MKNLIILLFNSYFLFCVNCDFGLSRQIELIEEWGCHNTEFRLTCKELDSTVAVLEATFTPHSNGFKLNHKISDMIKETEAGKKFLEALRSSEENVDETDVEDAEQDIEISNENIDSKNNNGTTAETVKLDTVKNYIKDANNDKSQQPRSDLLVEKRHKRTSLKSTLEHMIVMYLRQLEIQRHIEYLNGNNINRNYVRYRRYLNSNNDNDYAAVDDNYKNINRIELGSRMIQINHTDDNIYDDDIDDTKLRNIRYEKVKTERSICNIRNITQRNMERLDLDKTLKNVSDTEHNIRNLISYRCSGKNHCSFIFAVDHPFAMLWTNVTVRIKYICIEGFRLNKFCGEQLTIGQEVQRLHLRSIQHNKFKPYDLVNPVSDNNNNNNNNNNVKGEPKAEARIQYDQTHHITILNNSEQESPNINSKLFLNKGKGKLRQSYDFQLVRVLESDKIHDEQNNKTRKTTTTTFPIFMNNIDDDNSVVEDVDDPSLNVLNSDNKILSTLSPPPPPPMLSENDDIIDNIIPNENYYDNNDDIIDDNEDVNNNNNNNNNIRIVRSTENYDILIKEGEEIITPFSYTTLSTPIHHQINSIIDLNNGSSSSSSSSSVRENEIYDDEDEIVEDNSHSIDKFKELYNKINSSHFMVQQNNTNKTKKLIDKLVINDDYYNKAINISNISTQSPPISSSTIDNIDLLHDAITINSNLDSTSKKSATFIYKNINNDSVIKYYNKNNNENGEDYDYSYEDYAFSINGTTISRKNKIRIHTSYQKSKIRHKLLQGFLATPGYPEYYIGETKCVWDIIAPNDLHIQLILLDINLRYDPICKDYIEVIDVNTGHILLHSCDDYMKPIEIISESNHLQVIVNTTSKLAYAKRGVLLHYGALGCPLPQIPTNVHLIHHSQYSIKFNCIPSYIFPDTAVSSRELFCTKKYTWDKTLPDCIIIDDFSIVKASGSGFVSLLNHKNSSITTNTMTDNKTDTMYDIVIPSLLIAALFIVNALVFLVIMRYRNKRKQRPEIEELTQL